MMKSLPHVVSIATGFMDAGLNVDYNETQYIDVMSNFIQSLQNLPSKPIVMLMTPVATKL